jgi:hypothetical protein
VYCPVRPCRVTQRGVDRMETFSSSQDYLTCLGLLRENMIDAGVRVLGENSADKNCR